MSIKSNFASFYIEFHLISIFADIFIEVNEHLMKPLEEYMLFTKTGAEKVNVSNSQGVRSAQCSPHFDIIHKTPSGPTNLNISQVREVTTKSKIRNTECFRERIKHGLKTRHKELYTRHYIQQHKCKRTILVK